MRVALAQIDPIIGDFSGNAQKICTLADKARNSGCDLVVFPELSLVGYPPRDLLEPGLPANPVEPAHRQELRPSG